MIPAHQLVHDRICTEMKCWAWRRELLRHRIAELEELPIVLSAEARKHIDNAWLWLTRGEHEFCEVFCERAECSFAWWAVGRMASENVATGGYHWFA
jgi:hypothetical protein